MTPMRSVQEPIYVARTALIGGGAVPRSWMPGNQWTTRQNPSLMGLRGGCSCGPLGGCGCGLSGLGQNVSLDQLISNATNWFTGIIQTNLPPSASVPPQYGSTGALSTQLQSWIPWIIGGFLLYKAIK